MNTWEPEDPELREDKLKTENQFVAKLRMENHVIYITAPSPEFQVAAEKPGNQKFIIYKLQMTDGELKAPETVEEYLQDSKVLKNTAEDDGIVVEQPENVQELRSAEFEGRIELADDVARKRWIQNQWLRYILREAGVELDLETVSRVEEESGYFYKKVQDFLTSSSTGQRTRILSELHSRVL